MPLFTLHVPPHDGPRKTRGQDGFAISFPAGLFHPLLHAGLSRRTPVINRTSLKGKYSFRVTFAKADTVSGPLAAESVFTVIEKQLGLRLEPTTGPREFIYIDQAERP